MHTPTSPAPSTPSTLPRAGISVAMGTSGSPAAKAPEGLSKIYEISLKASAGEASLPLLQIRATDDGKIFPINFAPDRDLSDSAQKQFKVICAVFERVYQRKEAADRDGIRADIRKKLAAHSELLRAGEGAFHVNPMAVAAGRTIPAMPMSPTPSSAPAQSRNARKKARQKARKRAERALLIEESSRPADRFYLSIPYSLPDWASALTSSAGIFIRTTAAVGFLGDLIGADGRTSAAVGMSLGLVATLAKLVQAWASPDSTVSRWAGYFSDFLSGTTLVASGAGVGINLALGALKALCERFDLPCESTDFNISKVVVAAAVGLVGSGFALARPSSKTMLPDFEVGLQQLQNKMAKALESGLEVEMQKALKELPELMLSALSERIVLKEPKKGEKSTRLILPPTLMMTIRNLFSAYTAGAMLRDTAIPAKIASQVLVGIAALGTLHYILDSKITLTCGKYRFNLGDTAYDRASIPTAALKWISELAEGLSVWLSFAVKGYFVGGKGAALAGTSLGVDAFVPADFGSMAASGAFATAMTASGLHFRALGLNPIGGTGTQERLAGIVSRGATALKEAPLDDTLELAREVASSATLLLNSAMTVDDIFTRMNLNALVTRSETAAAPATPVTPVTAFARGAGLGRSPAGSAPVGSPASIASETAPLVVVRPA